MRPAIALRILHGPVRQVISLAADVPATDGVAQTTTPSAPGYGNPQSTAR